MMDACVEEHKRTRFKSKNHDCFRCGSPTHRHSQCVTPITHPGVIKRSRSYSERMRIANEAGRIIRGEFKAIVPRRDAIISENEKEVEENHINTCILLNETVSEINLYATANPHMVLLDTASPVTIVRRQDVLSDVRMVENELLVFGNHKGVKVEAVGNLGLISNIKVLASLRSIILSVSGLQSLGYELVFRKHPQPVEIKNIESGAVIYGVLAAGVYWIHLEHIYDIAFRQGMSIEEATKRAISCQINPEKVDSTGYKPEDWGTNEEIDKCTEECSLNMEVHIDGEAQLRSVAMMSDDEHYFPPPKENGEEYILLDTCAGISCFNRLRFYDIIDWSKTGILKIGLQGQLLKFQGVGSSGVVNDIHFCETGENVLAMSSLGQAGWSMRMEIESIQLCHDLTGTLVLLQLIHGKYYVNEQDLDWLLLRDVAVVGEGIDREQELSDDEMPPLVDPIDAELEGDQDSECQVHSETEGIFRGDFTCVNGDGEIMTITGDSMREWTKEIIAQRQRAVMEENATQRTLHCVEYSISANNLSPQEHIRLIEAIDKYPEAARNKSLGLKQSKKIRSPMIGLMKFGQNRQVPEVLFNRVTLSSQIRTTQECGHISSINSAKGARALYKKAGAVICKLLRNMFQSPVESARVCGFMMTANMYEIMCTVSEYIGIELSDYAEIVDIFTMSMMYYDAMEERAKATMLKAFPKKV